MGSTGLEEMDAYRRTRKHSCSHCQQEGLYARGCRTFGGREGDTIKWRLILQHGPYEVKEAASSGCPFFVWLWNQLRVSRTPPEQMKRTTIVLEVEANSKVRSFEGPSDHMSLTTPPASLRHDIWDRIYDIIGCTIKVETRDYTWVPARFDVLSDWGMQNMF